MQLARLGVVLTTAVGVGLIVAAIMALGNPGSAPAGPSRTPCFMAPSLPGPPAENVTVAGPSYGDRDAASPTWRENQSKVWFHDGSWWSVMVDPGTGAWAVNRLVEGVTWQPTPAKVDARRDSLLDVLADGNQLYVAAGHRLRSLGFTRLEYDAEQQHYVVSRGFPLQLQHRRTARVVIAKDGTDRLWMSFVGPVADGSIQLLLVVSEDDGASWSEPFVPNVADQSPISGGTSALVKFDGRIGVMWSNERTEAFRFAIHRDEDPLDIWSLETPLEGPGMVDDHVSVRAASDGTIFAAIKTSMGDEGEPDDAPLVVLLTRTPDGTWKQEIVGTVAERLTRAFVVLNEQSRDIYVIASRSEDVVYKRASIDHGSFAGGRGTPLVRQLGVRLRYPTGPRHPVDADSGLLVLASGNDGTYYHGYLELSGSAPTLTCPPTGAG